MWIFLLQGQVQGHLVKIQPKFKADLLEKVVVFREDSANFMGDYDEVYIEDITRWREDMNFMSREHKIHVFELTCSILFIYKSQ